MPQINLLPWREELRKERQRNFLVAIAGAVVAGLGIIGAANLVYGARISHQQDRNALLDSEIKILEESIKEIDGIERQKARLLARMEVIEELQQSRPEVVHLFDELTRTIPDGVHLQSVTQRGRQIRVAGVAQSSTRVSSYMRNIDGSEWVGTPDLEKIQTVDRGQRRERFSFELNAQQRLPTAEEDAGGRR
ncbi:MAG: PilN domain-containing protein [Pseudomonadota bacterium]